MKPEEHIIYKLMTIFPDIRYLVFNDFIRYNHSMDNKFFTNLSLNNVKTNKTIFDHSYEPIYYSLDSTFWDSKWLETKRADYKFLISEKNSKDLEKVNRLGFKTVHWFSHGYLCSEYWFRLYNNISLVTTKKPIFSPWICANRLIDGNRSYRVKFLNMIDTNTGTYSVHDKDPQTGRSLSEIYPKNKVQPASFDNHENSSAWITLRQINCRQTTVDLNNPIEKPKSTDQLFFNSWCTSFLHVVTETVVDRTHLTEKIFKPVVLHQPFVLVGGSGCLKYMREYGFETFSQWWDESYDNIEDLDLRMQAVAKIVNRIGNMSLDELEDMRSEMWPILEHNYNWFYNGFSDRVWKELVLNLKSVL